MRTVAKTPTDAKAAPEAAGAIDLEHLRRFTLGDAKLELEILWLFIGQAPVTMEALKLARTNEDWAMAAHTLKGSARAVGAWRVARLAEQAEHLDGPQDPIARDSILAQLEDACAEARAQIVALGSPA